MVSQYVKGCKNKGRRGEKHLAGKDSLTPKDSTTHVTMFGPRPMTLVGSNFAKQIKKTLHKRKKHLFLWKKG